ncbi:hypothetical protein FQN57_003001 [Myotisia sp. PD_48]|nr:hypothetical protein FQN57_003001 [Myotisia sp. PD_48]
MYFTPSQTLEYLRGLLDPQNSIVRMQNQSKLVLGLIPDFLTIHSCSETIKKFEIESKEQNQIPTKLGLSSPTFLLGAQDCFWENSGPYTGEISPSNLRSMNVSVVELGHAERKRIFQETDEQVARKAAAVSAQGMIPLVCVGELAAPGSIVSEAVGVAIKECEIQVKAILDAIPPDAPVIFAYEPVWAIGQPVPAGVDHISAVVKGIRMVIEARAHTGDAKIIYGGSAGPGLWSEGGLGKAVDGMFLGRFAHQIEGVKKVLHWQASWPVGTIYEKEAGFDFRIDFELSKIEFIEKLKRSETSFIFYVKYDGRRRVLKIFQNNRDPGYADDGVRNLNRAHCEIRAYSRLKQFGISEQVSVPQFYVYTLSLNPAARVPHQDSFLHDADLPSAILI